MSLTMQPKVAGIGPRMDKIQYTSDALENDIERLCKAWRRYKRSRKRTAIYRFLNTVLEIATIWRADGKLLSRAANALRMSGGKQPLELEPFRALIAVAARPRPVDDRTLSKWSRTLRFAASKKLPSTPLRKFIKRYGGINDCAAEFTRRAKRRSVSDIPEAFRKLDSSDPRW